MLYENGFNFCEICCWLVEIGVYSCIGGGICFIGVVFVGVYISCCW